jgi:hypothetical protein
MLTHQAPRRASRAAERPSNELIRTLFSFDPPPQHYARFFVCRRLCARRLEVNDGFSGALIAAHSIAKQNPMTSALERAPDVRRQEAA